MVAIREANLLDVPTLVEMSRELAAEMKSGPGEMTEDAARRFIIEDPARCALLAGGEGEDVGYALHTPVFDTATGQAGLELTDLYVRPAFRQAGVAAALIAGVARSCLDQALSFVRWGVSPHATEASWFDDALGAEARPQVARAVSGSALEAVAATHGLPSR